MQGKNFSGRNLRGRSFKNQDLTKIEFNDREKEKYYAGNT